MNTSPRSRFPLVELDTASTISALRSPDFVRWRAENPNTALNAEGAPLAGLRLTSALLSPFRGSDLPNYWFHADGTDGFSRDSGISGMFRLADLTGADLSGASLCALDLREANLTNADLSGADLVNARLQGAKLDGANLAGCDLAGATLRSASLNGCDLSGASFVPFNMGGLALIETNTARADFTGATWDGAWIAGCDFSKAIVDSGFANSRPDWPKSSAEWSIRRER